MLIRRTPSALATLLSASLLGACGASNAAQTSDVEVLQERLEQLERTNGRLMVRIQDTEERLFLLQDRVEANRINVGRRDTDSIRAARARTIEPAREPTRQYLSPVTSSAPPPFPNVDPLVSDLPVQRLGPAGGAGQPAADSAEVVIDQAEFEARYGGSGGATSAPAPRSTARASTPARRQALPPVDVGSHRLPVASDDSNVPVQPAAPATTSSSPLDVYRSAVELFNAAEYSDSLDALNRFVAMGPEADYMDNALFWMGECLYGLGRYQEALSYFQRVVSEYPDGNKVPDSLLKEALTYERLSNPGQASTVLGTLVETYPTTDAAERARQRLRDLQ